MRTPPTTRSRPGGSSSRSVAGTIHDLLGEPPEVRVVGPDGSSAGPDGGRVLRIRTTRGLSYIATHPGQLGFVRAYLQGDLVVDDRAVTIAAKVLAGSVFTSVGPDGLL